jgi:DNA helicase-2/ATP-dependent DNA helicase PcrA
MAIADSISRQFPELNASQRDAVGYTEGPVLVIAGPGSGKTKVLVVRTLNLLMQGLAQPREIVLCTFTEKAAFELRDRLSVAARDLDYTGDLSELVVGTIHGICNEFIRKYRQHTPLGSNYEVLDDLTQLLFMFDHFDEIIGPEEGDRYLRRWSTKWSAIKGARDYFNKITEELVDSSRLSRSGDAFVSGIGHAYGRYRRLLFDKNRIDFAHQQLLFFQLLDHQSAGPTIRGRVRYVMVDEYQDTNFVQEQLVFRLASGHNNVCVVGDEDQSLYRFRGATVRNILEFPDRWPNCRTINLTRNYRSHDKIVKAYDKYMRSWDWSNPTGRRFRFDKTIIANPGESYPNYPAVFAVWGQNEAEEAQRFAHLVRFLLDNRVIEDASQAALLLHSVRLDHSERYIRALERQGIASYCPRAKAYFENEDVRLIVGCFAILLGYFGPGRGNLAGAALLDLARYVDECLMDLGRRCAYPHPLAECLQKYVREIASLKDSETLDRRLADYFYQFVAREPFATFLKDENRARNLATFSQLLNVFQSYYHYAVITARNREPLRFHFFNSFLRLLHDGGIDEYEDPDQPFPKGYVQVLTIHQSKGLEFPVVVVGSLAVQTSSPKEIDRVLGTYYERPPYEPEDRVTGFDRMRLHYVAFSRAEKLLVLTTTETPKTHFQSIFQGLPQWPWVEQDVLRSLAFQLRKRAALKKTFSFTSDLKVYETCPRQYQLYRQYEFVPARSAEFFFGTLVHQTIEDVHRRAMDSRLDELDEVQVRAFFDANFRRLLDRGLRPIGPRQREEGFAQVRRYVDQNQDELRRVIETEVDVSVEKDNYILAGKIDLLLGKDDRLELLDFKSQPRPVEDDERLGTYYKQLCIYAHILQQRYGKRPERLLLYWTGEELKSDALMVFPYRPDLVQEAGTHFDQVVAQILAKDFAVRAPPESKVCGECDFRTYCSRQGTIRLAADP